MKLFYRDYVLLQWTYLLYIVSIMHSLCDAVVKILSF